MVVYPYNIGIQIKQKKLTETFIMMSNWEKRLLFHGLYKHILALRVLTIVLLWPFIFMLL